MESVQQRVLAAGYGAMLERHGFEAVTKTTYKLSRPGIVWYAGLGKGDYEIPDSFRDYVACEIEGLPELMEKLGQVYKRNLVPGTRIPCDWYMDIPRSVQDAEEKAYWANRPTTWLDKFLARFRNDGQRPRNFAEGHPNIIFTPNNRGYIWRVPTFHLFQGFVDELIHYWETCTWPEIEKRLTLTAIVKTFGPLEEWQAFSGFAVSAAFLAGEHSMLDDYFTYLIEKSHMPLEDIERQLESSGLLKPARLKQRGWTREAAINREHSFFLDDAKQAECARKILYENQEKPATVDPG